jgi:hypothetical protein
MAKQVQRARDSPRQFRRGYPPWPHHNHRADFVDASLKTALRQSVGDIEKSERRADHAFDRDNACHVGF